MPQAAQSGMLISVSMVTRSRMKKMGVFSPWGLLDRKKYGPKQSCHSKWPHLTSQTSIGESHKKNRLHIHTIDICVLPPCLHHHVPGLWEAPHLAAISKLQRGYREKKFQANPSDEIAELSNETIEKNFLHIIGSKHGPTNYHLHKNTSSRSDEGSTTQPRLEYVALKTQEWTIWILGNPQERPLTKAASQIARSKALLQAVSQSSWASEPTSTHAPEHPRILNKCLCLGFGLK